MAQKKEKEKEISVAYKVSKINTTKFSYNDLEENQVSDLFENEDNLKFKLLKLSGKRTGDKIGL